MTKIFSPLFSIFIIGLFAFLIIFLRINLIIYGHANLVRILDAISVLISFLLLWKISGGRYNSHHGIRGWLGLSGLLKAFIILAISIGLASFATMVYVYVAIMPLADNISHLEKAFQDFDGQYNVFPGESPSPITTDVYNELKGTISAKINTQHIDFIAMNNVRSINDFFGRPYWYRIDTNSRHPNFRFVVIISCGANGIFENGKGDDLSF